jgi:hypothetical protein
VPLHLSRVPEELRTAWEGVLRGVFSGGEHGLLRSFASV